MNDDIASARRAIMALAPKKQLRRYPPELRARLAAVVRAHPERTPWSLATELDMTPAVLYRIVREERARGTALAPVRVVDEGPRRAQLRAVVIDGLDIESAAALIRALS